LFGSDLQINALQVVADAPKRNEVQCLAGHSAYYACSYCLRKAKQVMGKTRRRPAWPHKKDTGEKRTHSWMEDMLEGLEDKSPEERKGLKGRSPLFDLQDFDVIEGVPTEYMHMYCEGIIKTLIR